MPSGLGRRWGTWLGGFVFFDGASHAFAGSGLPHFAALKVEVVGFNALSLPLSMLILLRLAKLEFQAFSDALGYLALHGKHVAIGLVKGLGPDVGLGLGVDQLDGDAQLAARLSHLAGEDGLDTERLADGFRVERGVFSFVMHFSRAEMGSWRAWHRSPRPTCSSSRFTRRTTSLSSLSVTSRRASIDAWPSAWFTTFAWAWAEADQPRLACPVGTVR